MDKAAFARMYRRLAVAAALLAVAGCGGLMQTALTGGSVPIGNALLQGVAVRADNTSQAVGGATVVLSTGVTQTSTTTATDGKFDFGQIQSGRFTCSITQPSSSVNHLTSAPNVGTVGSGGSSNSGSSAGKPSPVASDGQTNTDLNALSPNWSWQFDVPVSTSAKIVAAVWPQWFDPKTVQRVEMAPTNVTLHPGESVRFVGTAYAANDKVIPLRTSLIMTGNIGTLNTDGVFTATTTGTGRITAWMAGYSASTDIQVTAIQSGAP